ncbi:MAG: YggS family pyridoxal phosphate-dependent enzyme [Ndongobacter sp.]|nr:YggS family pyridoxal phosphate-dependent enzyme [Ndongobacter sp.]
MDLRKNIDLIRQKIEKSAAVFGHAPSDITLVAVTKTVEVPLIQEALANGITHVGENRVQELIRKQQAFQGAQVHMIGRLQSNKIRQLPGRVSLVQSVDRQSLLQEMERIGERENFVFRCLLEMNLAQEESKGGMPEEELLPTLEAVEACSWVRVRGLMTVAPAAQNPEEVRWVFQKMRKLFDKAAKLGYNNSNMEILSMGMSNDFGVALEEGSTMVRIGSAIFGQRIYQ